MRPSSRFVVVLGLGLVASGPPLAAQPADTTRISHAPLFTGRDLWLLGAFTLGAAAAWPLDQTFARRLQQKPNQENKFFQRTATIFRLIGDPGAFIIGASMYSAGRLWKNQKLADLGFHGTEALAVGAVAADVMKVLAGRARPYVNVDDPRNFGLTRGLLKDDYRSFPSGHSMAGFAAASAVSSETARWWPASKWYIGPVMYGGAGLIAASRMYNNAHWASDVMVGAAIGTFAGLKIDRYQHSHPGNRVDRWFLGGSLSPAEGGGHAMHWSIGPMIR